jgi:uracil-DNA glycosylase family 4
VNDQQRKTEYLKAMGIQQWVSREAVHSLGNSEGQDVNGEQSQVRIPSAQNAPGVLPLQADENTSMQLDISQLSWEDLKARVTVCTRCEELAATRTQTVFGVGDHHAQVMVIGEAPGADEDRQGEPFVGRAGKLLNNMLLAIGYQREQVYIANILKCRPPGNRDPRPEEIVQCESFLKRQVELVKPKVILAVGRIAAQNLLKVDTPIGKLRGKMHQYNNTPLVVTYHPAYLLRKPTEKARAWDDLRFALSVINEQSLINNRNKQ